MIKKCQLFLATTLVFDVGTGAVHIAPAHGLEDYVLGH